MRPEAQHDSHGVTWSGISVKLGEILHYTPTSFLFFTLVLVWVSRSAALGSICESCLTLGGPRERTCLLASSCYRPFCCASRCACPSSPPYLFLSLDIFIPMIYLFEKYLLKANYMPSSFVGMQKMDKVLLLVKFSSADEYLISN